MSDKKLAESATRPDVGVDRLISRRSTLALLGFGSGALLLAACSKQGGDGGAAGSSSAAQSGTGCNTPLDEGSQNLRKTLQYKEQTDQPAKHCSACAQYTGGQYGECGGCKLFTGPVKPNGVCLSFAPLAAPGGSASASAKASG